eukprot:scaffold383446_cov11-Prasinocladus_malaysianus.AAC.1
MLQLYNSAKQFYVEMPVKYIDKPPLRDFLKFAALVGHIARLAQLFLLFLKAMCNYNSASDALT